LSRKGKNGQIKYILQTVENKKALNKNLVFVNFN